MKKVKHMEEFFIKFEMKVLVDKMPQEFHLVEWYAWSKEDHSVNQFK